MAKHRELFRLALLALSLGACGEGTGPSFPARGERIAFQRAAGGSDYNILLIDPDRSNIRNLTGALGGRNIHPAWSPDGRSIAFVSDRAPAGLYVMNADGSGLRDLSNGGAGGVYPTWAPDGRRLAFSSSRGGGSDIWVVGADGTNPVQITFFGAEAPAWSPDGRWIAYTDYDARAIGLTDPQGTAWYIVSFPPPGALDRDPAWSPDGQILAFVRTTDSTAGRLHLLQAGDTIATPLTGFAVGADWTPAFSPDGNRLVFAHDVDADFDLYIINVDGTGLFPLTNGPEIDARPTW